MLPQCLKILRSHSSEGASPLTLAIYSAGALAWLIYGWYTADLPLIASSILALVPSTFTLIYMLRTSRRTTGAMSRSALEEHRSAA